MDTNKEDACVGDDKTHTMAYICQAQKNSSFAKPHLLELHINSLLNSCLVKHVNPQ